MEFKDVFKTILDLGFPIAVCLWLLWRDFKWIELLSEHGVREIELLNRLLTLLVEIERNVHGRANADK